MTDATPADDPSATPLESVVGDWLTLPDLAGRLGVPVSRVRRMLQDRLVLGVKVGNPPVLRVPARFFTESGPVPELRGTFTVLADGGMDDAEIIRWLFTDDDSLPVRGAPLDALLAGHKTEIRRRAMELAF